MNEARRILFTGGHRERVDLDRARSVYVAPVCGGIELDFNDARITIPILAAKELIETMYAAVYWEEAGQFEDWTEDD